MCKIVLSEWGDAVMHFSPNEHELTDYAGRHEVCGGEMHIMPISHSYNAIVCYKCILRIVLPALVNTFGKLKEHFKCYNDEKEKP